MPESKAIRHSRCDDAAHDGLGAGMAVLIFGAFAAGILFALLIT